MRLPRVLSLARLGAVFALVLSGCRALPGVPGAPVFQADALVGADTWSFTDLTLRPSIQQALYTKDVLDTFASVKESGSGDLHQLPTPSGRRIDFERDLLPHLDGELAIGLSGPVTSQYYTFLAHTNDARAILGLLVHDDDPELTPDARGVIRYAPLDGKSVAAGYKNWIIYTDNSDSLDQTLDRIDARGGPSLATEARYRSVIARLPADRLGFGYADTAPILADGHSASETRVADALHARGRIAYSLAFEAGPEEGVRALRVQSEFVPDELAAPATTPKGDALLAMDRLPLGSMAAYAGSSISQQVDAVAGAMRESDGVPLEVEHLLQSFAGPFAVGLTPPLTGTGGGAPGSMIGGLFFAGQLVPDADAAGVQDPAAALVDTIHRSANDGDAWQHELLVDDGWVSINAVPASLGLDYIEQRMLADDRQYQWVRPGFVRDGTNFYMNLGGLLSSFQGSVPSTQASAVLSPIRVIGASWLTDGQGDGHGQILVMIAVP
jgi:hypothetical protein